jgi:uncharacterized protein involved in outer membrane biogenesis
MRLAGLARLAAVAASLTVAASACQSGHAAPARSPVGARAHLRVLAAEYLAIARPANRRLDVEENRYTANAHRNLAAAEAALRAQAATERGFDAQLLAIRFPAPIAASARVLVRANQSRIDFTELQARSTSIPELLTFLAGHRAVDAAVEVQVRLIRRQLGLPPPETS